MTHVILGASLFCSFRQLASAFGRVGGLALHLPPTARDVQQCHRGLGFRSGHVSKPVLKGPSTQL